MSSTVEKFWRIAARKSYVRNDSHAADLEKAVNGRRVSPVEKSNRSDCDASITWTTVGLNTVAVLLDPHRGRVTLHLSIARYYAGAKLTSSTASPTIQADGFVVSRITWRYNVSRSTGSRPASLIRFRILSTVRHSGVVAPAS